MATRVKSLDGRSASCAERIQYHRRATEFLCDSLCGREQLWSICNAGVCGRENDYDSAKISRSTSTRGADADSSAGPLLVSILLLDS